MDGCMHAAGEADEQPNAIHGQISKQARVGARASTRNPAHKQACERAHKQARAYAIAMHCLRSADRRGRKARDTALGRSQAGRRHQRSGAADCVCRQVWRAGHVP
eukprot:102761-Chlamydomonas_euryale.AAC.2